MTDLAEAPGPGAGRAREVPLDEDLATAAALARDLADRLCTTTLGGDGCGATHGVWPELRLLGLAADPRRHDDLWARELGDAPGRQRLLVAGAADHGMVAAVLRARPTAAQDLQVAVVDRCPTPVLLSAWHAMAHGVAVQGATADLRTPVDLEPVDVVCTHSLLRLIAPEHRPALLSSWRDVLVPGGRVVTVTRLGVDGPDGEADRERRVEAFASRVDELVAERERQGATSGLRLDDLVARARRFSASVVVHPVDDEAALRAVFDEAGFDVVRCDVRRLDGPLGGERAAPGLAQPATYAELVAVRR